MNNEDKRSIKVAVISTLMTGILFFSLEKGWESYSDWKSKSERVDKRLNNLYRSIILKEGVGGHTPPKESDSRVQKLEFVRKIQKKIHSEAFEKLVSAVEPLAKDSSDDEWNETISVHMNLEKMEHIDFPEYIAQAFWETELQELNNDTSEVLAKTVNEIIQKPASFLLGSELAVPAEALVGDKMIDGIFVNKKDLKFVPADYPVVLESKGKKAFVPSYNSLEEINYFQVQQTAHSEDLPEKKKYKNEN